jgi:Asp-tRNA(Asn)/Glu-tRNA(Gln) amidotransferase A subunit family amidase
MKALGASNWKRLTLYSRTFTFKKNTMNSVFQFTISETLEKYRRKEISPVELIRAYCERVHALQPSLNAFVHLDCDSAIASARQAEEAIARGEKLTTLHGIPLTVKSCIDVAGWPCPAGSVLRKDYIATVNAPLVTRLENSGGIILGNTNTPEYLMAYETDNRLNGKTSNPWNLFYSPGGSSGGEAAAIASGCSMGGVGSDGGGSIRVPAHFSGICGMKPTPGRIPSTGHFPPPGGAFTWIGVVGPMARSVRDLRVLFNVLAGPDDGDPLSAPVPLEYQNPKKLRGTRIGLLQSSALGTATPATEEAVNQAARLLVGHGFLVEPISLEKLDAALNLWHFFWRVIAVEIRNSTKGQESLLSPMLAEFLTLTADEPAVTFDSFIAASIERDNVRMNILRQMRDVPILLSPVSSGPAFKHGAGNYRTGDPFNYRETMRYCQWVNLIGFPGLSIPMSHSPEKLPINVQLIGRPYEEELLLQIGQILERERGPWEAPTI